MAEGVRDAPGQDVDALVTELEDRSRVGRQHEALQLVVPALVVDDRLQHPPGDAAGMVAGGPDGDPVDVERRLVLRGAARTERPADKAFLPKPPQSAMLFAAVDAAIGVAATR